MKSTGVYRSKSPLLLGALLVLCSPGVLSAQQAEKPSPLTLRQAVDIALEKNPGRKAMMADTKAAAADVRSARSLLLPRVTFSETATSGNDPVYVFGSKLRQQRFTTADFNVLNAPTPFGNYSTRFGGTWNLFDSSASWRGIRRAEKMEAAAKNQLDRTDQEIVFRAVDSYYGVLRARKQIEVAEQSVQTAQAVLERSKNRFENGLVVESDLLSAKVRWASRQEELIRARNDLAMALAQLNTVMGISTKTEYEPADVLAERNLPAMSLEELEKHAVEMRPDMKRIRASEEAQKESVAMAKSAFGPRVNAFASWEADNPTFVAGGGGNNWIGGIELQFDLFEGGAKRAQLSKEKALQEKVLAFKQSAEDQVRLEVRKAYYDVDASRQQVEVARATIEQSKESLRIVQNRYEAGLLTITDLLTAEDAEHRSQTDYWDTVYRYQVGYANLELASGTLNPQSPVVTP